MFLARKITRAKWKATREFSTDEIPADAVTADLRTQENSLSFWQCPTNSESDVEEAALAIAAGRDYVDKLDLVWLADDELEFNGLSLKNTIGRTPVKDMEQLHVDATRLDYVRLGRIALRVVAAIKADRWCRLTRPRVKRLIVAAIRQGRIDRADLHHRMREELAN